MNGKEFKKALDNIVKEKNIDPEIVYDAMELALTSAYKKNFNSQENVKIVIDEENASIKVYSLKEVVEEVFEVYLKKPRLVHAFFLQVPLYDRRRLDTYAPHCAEKAAPECFHRCIASRPGAV